MNISKSKGLIPVGAEQINCLQHSSGNFRHNLMHFASVAAILIELFSHMTYMTTGNLSFLHRLTGS